MTVTEGFMNAMSSVTSRPFGEGGMDYPGQCLWDGDGDGDGDGAGDRRSASVGYRERVIAPAAVGDRIASPANYPASAGSYTVTVG